jgi:putative ABC transport system permease protein
VAIGTAVPTDTAIGSGWTRIRRPGETYDHPWQAPGARFNSISPGYFDALEVPFLAGRDFTSADRLETPRVAIVNQRFADKEWPGENPIGKRVQRYLTEEEKADDPAGEWLEVVGMVPDLRFAEFDNDDDQQGIYVPVAQVPPRFAWIVVKTRGEPGAFKEPLRRAVLDVDPDLPLYFVRTMPEVLERTMFYHNLLAVLFSIFGAAAVVLACVGLYGVMAFSVTQRIQEMGVRMALGARTRDIVGMVLRQGLVRVAIGLVLGLALGAGLGQALVAVLYSVGAVDPVTFVAIPVLLAAIALLACVIPARKASSVDPVAALRYE